MNRTRPVAGYHPEAGISTAPLSSAERRRLFAVTASVLASVFGLIAAAIVFVFNGW